MVLFVSAYFAAVPLCRKWTCESVSLLANEHVSSLVGHYMFINMKDDVNCN